MNGPQSTLSTATVIAYVGVAITTTTSTTQPIVTTTVRAIPAITFRLGSNFM